MSLCISPYDKVVIISFLSFIASIKLFVLDFETIEVWINPI